MMARIGPLHCCNGFEILRVVLANAVSPQCVLGVPGKVEAHPAQSHIGSHAGAILCPNRSERARLILTCRHAVHQKVRHRYGALPSLRFEYSG
jgi:hypothetical protein